MENLKTSGVCSKCRSNNPATYGWEQDLGADGLPQYCPHEFHEGCPPPDPFEYANRESCGECGSRKREEDPAPYSGTQWAGYPTCPSPWHKVVPTNPAIETARAIEAAIRKPREPAPTASDACMDCEVKPSMPTTADTFRDRLWRGIAGLE